MVKRENDIAFMPPLLLPPPPLSPAALMLFGHLPMDRVAAMYGMGITVVRSSTSLTCAVQFCSSSAFTRSTSTEPPAAV